MKREKTLILNTVILGLGRFLPQVTALVTLPIYTGMLTTAEYGRYDLVNTIVYILGIVLIVQIQQGIFRFLLDVRGEEKQNYYISSTIFFEIVPSIIGSVGFALFYHELSLPTCTLLGIYLFLNLQYSIIGQIARGLGNTKIYAAGAVIQALLNMVLVVVLVSGFFGIEWGFNGLFISLDLAYLAGTLFQFIACKQWRYIKIKYISKGHLKELLAYSWPMVPNTLSIWIINTCDKFIIRLFMGVEYNGIFAVAQKIPNIFNMAYQTFNMAWQESASITLKDDDHDSYYTEVFGALFNFLTVCMLVLIAATPILFKILIRGDYDEAYNQIPLLYVGVFFASLSSFYGSIYVAQKATKAVGVSSALGAGLNCIINLSMIHWAGLYAASVSTILSYMVLVIYRCVDIKRKKLANLKYNKMLIALCFVLIIVSCILCYQQNLICNIINLILGVVGFFTLNRDMIRGLIDSLMQRVHK